MNPKMDIPITQDILLFRLMLCTIVLFFGRTYAITLFVDSFFLPQTYVVILLKLRLFETEKTFFQEIVKLFVVLFSSEFFVFVVVSLSLFWCSCLEAPICTTICMTVKHVFKRNLTYLTQLFNVFPYYFLSRTPNLSWVGEHFLWCTYISDPYFSWRWKICALKQPSRDGRDLQGRMALGSPHQVFLWMTSELDLGSLWMDAWSHLAFCCHRFWKWYQW